MRLAPACSLIWIVQAVVAWQQPLAAPEALYSSRPERVTLIDLLSASEHHTTLLHLLQRARLVPTLNRIANQVRLAFYRCVSVLTWG